MVYTGAKLNIFNTVTRWALTEITNLVAQQKQTNIFGPNN